MSYSSTQFLLFFLPIAMILYQCTPKKFRYITLLVVSYVFIFFYSGLMSLWILVATISSYLTALVIQKNHNLVKDKVIDKKQAKKKNKRWMATLVIVDLLVILVFKYYNFFAGSLNGILFTDSNNLPLLKLIVPIGISFYTLQAISYVVDVFRKKIKADKNPLHIALYLSFFPTVVEGPITQYDEVVPKLIEGQGINFENLRFGFQRIIWGLFKNILIADRLNMLVTRVFMKYTEYSGMVVVVAMIAYTVQLYMNFSGTIDITIGIGKIFNVSIPENFKQPFFSRTTTEFWSRWHISLGRWFKEYIYYPISLSSMSKKMNKYLRPKIGKYFAILLPTAIALFAVWISNGLWHGPKWSFVFFGLYYFVLIMLGKITEPLVIKIAEKLHINRDSWWYRIIQAIKMLTIVFIGELFFRADGFLVGVSMFKSMGANFTFQTLSDGTLLQLGLDVYDFIVIGAALVVVLIVSIIQESGRDVFTMIAGSKLPVRWLIYYTIILAIVIFGAYGDGYLPPNLIYGGF